MIHDQSSTGSTLFIEPMSVVKLNNDIRELELQEQKEIEVILADLSQQIALEQETISLNLKIMVQLDFIFARAALAMDMNASEPIFNDEGRINLKKARHPLINKRKWSQSTSGSVTHLTFLSSQVRIPVVKPYPSRQSAF